VPVWWPATSAGPTQFVELTTEVKRMATLIVQIDVPPVGELETSGDGTSPTQEQMDEEQAAREKTIGLLRPYLESLPKRPPHRSGNVSAVQLLGKNTWSNLNRYALLVDVDIGDPGIEKGLLDILPDGSTVDVHAGFTGIDEWSATSEDD
jgi:hypothetical protein